MNRHRNIAEILGYTKSFVWLRIPLFRKNRIYTLPREVLKHGMATAAMVEVEYDPKSEEFDGDHFVIDLEMIRIVRRKEADLAESGAAGSMGPEGTGQEGLDD